MAGFQVSIFLPPFKNDDIDSPKVYHQPLPFPTCLCDLCDLQQLLFLPDIDVSHTKKNNNNGYLNISIVLKPDPLKYSRLLHGRAPLEIEGPK